MNKYQRQVKTIRVKTFLFLLNLFFISCFNSILQAQEDGERVINKVPKHIPIKIEIINGDMQSKLEDLQIKVTNSGKKPIYYLHLMLNTSDYSQTFGLPSMYYGNRNLTYSLEPAKENDIFLKTDEATVFEITKIEAEGFVKMLEKNYIYDSPKFELLFQFLSFGDGTGFATTGGKLFPSKEKK